MNAREVEQLDLIYHTLSAVWALASKAVWTIAKFKFHISAFLVFRLRCSRTSPTCLWTFPSP